MAVNYSFATMAEAAAAGYQQPDGEDQQISTDDGVTYVSPGGQVAEILWFSEGTNRNGTSGAWAAMFAPPCLYVCPACGLNLRREGFPHQHQHADTGEVCSYTWS